MKVESSDKKLRAPASSNGKTEFSAKDNLPFGKLSFNMSEQEVVDTLKRYSLGFSRYWQESSLKDPRYILNKVYCEEHGKVLIRGLSVGSTKNDVIKAFYYENRPDGHKPAESKCLPDSLASAEYLYGDLITGGHISHLKDETQCITYWHTSGGIKFFLDSGDKVKAVEYDCLVNVGMLD
jgi:hypothetical protein